MTSKTTQSSALSICLNLAEWGAVAVVMTFLVVWFGSAFV
jgi:hypothetical protein